MRNLMKLIAITAMTALLLLVLITCASADEKIYTSPVFKLPESRLERAEEIIENQEQEGDPEEAEDPDAEPEDEEGVEELGEDAGEVEEQTGTPKREVIIRSSQGEVVTEGDMITLTSELKGFADDDLVEYQWQVDRGDGEGWVDVNGGNRFKYTFIANKETIQYSWRLIVNVVGE